MVSLFATEGFSQSAEEDFSYDKKAVNERKVIPHRYTREANVKYYQRIHRIIDVREKQNLPMHWPRNPFYNIIYCAATSVDCPMGHVTAYTSDSLENGGVYSEDDLKDRGGYEFVTKIPDPDYPGDFKDTVMVVQFEAKDIRKYRVMEDWIFDYNYSDFRARIIAIAPLFDQKASGVSIGEASLFWVKMDELRPVLVNQEIFNPHNSAARLSFDDWFEMRMFSSYVIKEENVWDYDIKYYPENEDNPFSSLIKAEEIKNNLFIFEHDLWEY
ncbi:MAG: gliding motility protein GldN [Flavobacteriales bacterium]|nr:gliding motility protein GldN [Flavobacteriales bacterium]